MALLKEFTTWPRHQLVFYKVTNNAINFQVRGATCAVGLATEPKESCEYQILLDWRTCCIQKDDERRNVSKEYPDLLSNEEFKNFWITWKNEVVAIGRGATELLRRRASTKHLEYVTFYVPEHRGSADWRCYLPPAIESLPHKHLSGGEPQWVEAEEELPDDALIGGFEGEFLYVMRAKHRGSLTPGKFVPSLGIGLLAWGGEAHEGEDMEILCGYNCWWKSARKGRVLAGAVLGGRSETGEALYVARAWHEGHLLPGKLQPSHGCCYVPYQGRELAKSRYEVLVTRAGDSPVYIRDSDSDNDVDSDNDADSELGDGDY